MSCDRWILLGASNAARGGLALLDAMRARAGGPVQCHAALGRGRSYGIKSRLLGRGLGSILDSALWTATADGDRARTAALVMDVGNDLFYGVPVPQVLAWVETCLQRLATRAANITLAGIPLAPLRRLQPWKFELFRRVMVPSCRLNLANGLVQAQALHDGLAALAKRHGTGFVAAQDEWYGVDPIHVRRRQWPLAAAQLLGSSSAATPQLRLDRPLARLSLFLAAPHERTWWGHQQRRSQPARRYADGSGYYLW